MKIVWLRGQLTQRTIKTLEVANSILPAIVSRDRQKHSFGFGFGTECIGLWRSINTFARHPVSAKSSKFPVTAGSRLLLTPSDQRHSLPASANIGGEEEGFSLLYS